MLRLWHVKGKLRAGIDYTTYGLVSEVKIKFYKKILNLKNEGRVENMMSRSRSRYI